MERPTLHFLALPAHNLRKDRFGWRTIGGEAQTRGGISPTEWYGISNEEGYFEIRNLPPSTYMITAYAQDARIYTLPFGVELPPIDSTS